MKEFIEIFKEQQRLYKEKEERQRKLKKLKKNKT